MVVLLVYPSHATNCKFRRLMKKLNMRDSFLIKALPSTSLCLEWTRKSPALSFAIIQGCLRLLTYDDARKLKTVQNAVLKRKKFIRPWERKGIHLTWSVDESLVIEKNFSFLWMHFASQTKRPLSSLKVRGKIVPILYMDASTERRETLYRKENGPFRQQ